MTLYQEMQECAVNLEAVSRKARHCKPHSTGMIGCYQYLENFSAKIKGWAARICIECGEKEE